MVATGLLQKLSCRVGVEANGRAAVELWRYLPYHLILMDCNIDGRVSNYSSQEANQHIPIVARFTANPMQGDRERCLESGNGRLHFKADRPPNTTNGLGTVPPHRAGSVPSTAITAGVVRHLAHVVTRDYHEILGKSLNLSPRFT